MNVSEDRLKPVMTPLYGFSGEKVKVVGSIMLPVTFGDSSRSVTRQVVFMVVKSLLWPITSY